MDIPPTICRSRDQNSTCYGRSQEENDRFFLEEFLDNGSAEKMAEILSKIAPNVSDMPDNEVD